MVTAVGKSITSQIDYNGTDTGLWTTSGHIADYTDEALPADSELQGYTLMMVDLKIIGPEKFGVVPTLKMSLSAYDFVGTSLSDLAWIWRERRK
jgi:hypothetical protein